MADFTTILKKAIDNAGNPSDAERRLIYERSRAALLAKLQSIQPALSPEDISEQRMNLEEAIQNLEAGYSEAPKKEIADAAKNGAIPAASSSLESQSKAPSDLSTTSADKIDLPAATSSDVSDRSKDDASSSSQSSFKASSIDSDDDNLSSSSESEASDNHKEIPSTPGASASKNAPDRPSLSDLLNRPVTGRPKPLTEDMPEETKQETEKDKSEAETGITPGKDDLHRLKKGALPAAAGLSQAASSALGESQERSTNRIADFKALTDSLKRTSYASKDRDKAETASTTTDTDNTVQPIKRSFPATASLPDTPIPQGLKKQTPLSSAMDTERFQTSERHTRRASYSIGILLFFILVAAAYLAYANRDLFTRDPASSTDVATSETTEPDNVAALPEKNIDRLMPDDQGEVADPNRQLAQTQETPASESEAPITVAETAILYEESEGAAGGTRSDGSIVWSLEDSAEGDAPIIRGVARIPARNLMMVIKLSKIQDESLSASHLIEASFSAIQPGGEQPVRLLVGINMKPDEEKRGEVLRGAITDLSNGVFLQALSGENADEAINVPLLKERGWFDMPVYLRNDNGSEKRGILTFEKGESGGNVFNQAFEAWGE